MNLRLNREWPSLIALLCLYAALGLLAPQFYSVENLRDVALANVAVLLVASGMTFVIILGQIDISVGSAFAVTSVLLGLLAKGGFSVALLPIVSLLLGGLLGALNGALISYVKAPSIVVTLATMVALREALRWLTGGAWVEGLPTTFQWFGLEQGSGEVILIGTALVIFTALWWGSQNLYALRAIYATGSDSEAARLAGISTRQITLWTFVLLGALTGLAALLNAVRFSDVPANSGINLELQAIAAVVVGGTPITGGKGSLLGTLLGVLLLGSIGPALTFLQINPYWVRAIQGAIVLVTVLFDALAAHRRQKLVLA